MLEVVLVLNMCMEIPSPNKKNVIMINNLGKKSKEYFMCISL